MRKFANRKLKLRKGRTKFTSSDALTLTVHRRILHSQFLVTSPQSILCVYKPPPLPRDGFQALPKISTALAIVRISPAYILNLLTFQPVKVLAPFANLTSFVLARLTASKFVLYYCLRASLTYLLP